jgi:RND family efflux transporter MFP subunit
MQADERAPEEERSLRENVTKPSRCAITGLAVLAAAFCAGCRGRVASTPQPHAPVVEVAPVIQRDLPIYGQWVGTLAGYLNAQISPQVSGYLIRQDYQEGSLVQKEQVLFEIDPRPFQAALDQAKAQLAQAKAQLAKTALDVKRDIPEAQAHAIPQSQLDNDRQAQLAAQAAVEGGEAAVEQATLNLGYTKVRSLIPGIAGVTTVQVGNLVGPSTVLTSVSEVNPIKVYFPITGIEYLRIASHVGGAVDLLSRANPMPLQLILPDEETYGYKGKILFTDRQVDSQTGTIQVVGAFPNPRNILRPGQTCRVRAVTELIKGALLVPQRAVTELQGGYQVAVVEPDNKISVRTVEVDERVATMWVISQGLKPGQLVVAEGTQKVRDGMPVTPKPYTPPGG